MTQVRSDTYDDWSIRHRHCCQPRPTIQRAVAYSCRYHRSRTRCHLHSWATRPRAPSRSNSSPTWRCGYLAATEEEEEDEEEDEEDASGEVLDRIGDGRGGDRTASSSSSLTAARISVRDCETMIWKQYSFSAFSRAVNSLICACSKSM